MTSEVGYKDTRVTFDQIFNPTVLCPILCAKTRAVSYTRVHLVLRYIPFFALLAAYAPCVGGAKGTEKRAERTRRISPQPNVWSASSAAPCLSL